MNRTRHLGRLGGLVAVVAAATPFAYLWVLQVTNARAPLTVRAVLELSITLASWARPRCWPGRPGWLLAAAAATLPADRRDWGRP
jgi:hypothetical protein